MSRRVFAELLGFHRSTKGLSQEQLAEASDTNPDTIGKLERGQRQPRPSTARLLADALKLSPEEELAFMTAASGRAAPSDSYAPGAPLPGELTTFVGREQEVEAVRRLLGEHRLVTLTGPGGVGKSRLALRVARGEVEARSESVWQVDLGATADPQLVVPAIAEALGVEPVPSLPLLTVLAQSLRRRRLLLALDNCEHQVETCARLVEELLVACPRLRVLATSREALRCRGEVVLAVPPLSVPPTDAGLSATTAMRFDAVHLFADRAAAAAPGFALTDECVPAIAELCGRLDGLPLALELAAARVRGLTVGQIAAGLEDRFRLLTVGERTAPARHQSLWAVVDWSHALLGPAEQRLFNRLSVFAAGFSVEAASAVCGRELEAPTGRPRHARGGPGDVRPEVVAKSRAMRAPSALDPRGVLDLLLRLVEKSLVMKDDGAGTDGEGVGARFRLLETLREFGRERLAQAGETAEVARLHLHYVLDVLEQTWTAPPERQEAWRRRLAAERDNLRAALRWAQALAEAEVGGRLGRALSRLADHLGDADLRLAVTPFVSEVRRLGLPAYAALLTRLLEQTDQAVLDGGAELLRIIGDHAGEAEVVQRRQQLEPDEATRGGLVVRRAHLLSIHNRVAEAISLLEPLAVGATARGDHRLHLDVLLEEGYARFQLGDCRRSRSAYNRALRLLERSESQLPPDVVAEKRMLALRGRGNVEHNADANAACAASHRRSLALARYRRDGPGTAMELVNLADALWGCWRYADSLDTYRDALRTANDLCYADGREFGLLCRGALLWSTGQYAAAADDLHAGLELARKVGGAWSLAYGQAYLSAVHASQGAISTALDLSRAAVATAQGPGDAYPLNLATVFATWQQELRTPGLPENGQVIDTALRQSRRLGLRGLALHLSWVRLLHRVAVHSISDEALDTDLSSLVEATTAHPPVKGAWELLGLQVVVALRRDRPGLDPAALQRLLADVSSRKSASLGSGEWAAFREGYHETRRPWEDRG